MAQNKSLQTPKGMRELPAEGVKPDCLSFRSPSGTTLLDDVARIFPDETGREPERVEKLRNGNSVSIYDSFEYDIVGNAIEISSNRAHAVETFPDGQLLGSYFLIGNSYGDLKDGPELRRTGDGWAYRINSAIRTSDDYLSSNSIIFGFPKFGVEFSLKEGMLSNPRIAKFG